MTQGIATQLQSLQIRRDQLDRCAKLVKRAHQKRTLIPLQDMVPYQILEGNYFFDSKKYESAVYHYENALSVLENADPSSSDLSALVYLQLCACRRSLNQLCLAAEKCAQARDAASVVLGNDGVCLRAFVDL